MKTRASQAEPSKPSKTQKPKRPFRSRDTQAHLIAQLANLVACLTNGLHACRVIIHVSTWVDATDRPLGFAPVPRDSLYFSEVEAERDERRRGLLAFARELFAFTVRGSASSLLAYGVQQE